MVAKIKSGKSLTGALNYNENKVKAGKAELISASGYGKSLRLLNFHDKLFRLRDLADRNQRTRTNTVHLSLNFDVGEQIDKDIMTAIADEYMNRIGFGTQPYLVYKHFDAGHPHLHIVSTNIEADGNRISLHNIGELVSEPARKAIELEFGLTQAGSKKSRLALADDADIQPLVYGATDTKRGITNIVNSVIKSYKFTSLPEFNAILNLYQVTADRGTKESVMFRKGGLNYWALGGDGKKTGVPIKASSVYAKPTLKLLDERFGRNELLRKPFKEKLKIKIDQVRSRAISLEAFIKGLGEAGVIVVIRQNTDGRIYGLSYIDQLNKAIFNGSDLGKNYSAAGIIESLRYKPTRPLPAADEKEPAKTMGISSDNMDLSSGGRTKGLLEDLLGPADPNGSIPDQFGPKKKRKKRRKLNR